MESLNYAIIKSGFAVIQVGYGPSLGQLCNSRMISSPMKSRTPKVNDATDTDDLLLAHLTASACSHDFDVINYGTQKLCKLPTNNTCRHFIFAKNSHKTHIYRRCRLYWLFVGHFNRCRQRGHLFIVRI